MSDETEPFAAASPAVTWPAQDPDRKALSCGPCGTGFAGDPAAAFTSPLLAAAVTEAATAAGWQQDGETWTCTVCQAKAAAGPAPEPAAPEAHEPPPDTNPYDQYAAITAELNADVSGFWGEVNQSNNAAGHKIRLRTVDATHNVHGLFVAAPDLLVNPELGGVLAVAELAWQQQLAWMRFIVADRSAESRVAA